MRGIWRIRQVRTLEEGSDALYGCRNRRSAGPILMRDQRFHYCKKSDRRDHYQRLYPCHGVDKADRALERDSFGLQAGDHLIRAESASNPVVRGQECGDLVRMDLVVDGDHGNDRLLSPGRVSWRPTLPLGFGFGQVSRSFSRNYRITGRRDIIHPFEDELNIYSKYRLLRLA